MNGLALAGVPPSWTSAKKVEGCKGRSTMRCDASDGGRTKDDSDATRCLRVVELGFMCGERRLVGIRVRLGSYRPVLKGILEVVDSAFHSGYIPHLCGPLPGWPNALSRLRSVLTDASEVEDESAGGLWGLWRGVTELVVSRPLAADRNAAVVVAVLSAVLLVSRSSFGPVAGALQGALTVPMVWCRRDPVAVFAVISSVAVAQWGPAVVHSNKTGPVRASAGG